MRTKSGKGELEQERKVATALSETIRLMAEIGAAIAKGQLSKEDTWQSSFQ